MNRVFLSIALFGSLVLARELSAVQNCEAYNNLRHTKNSGDVTLQSGNSYEILREQNGNYYIKVPNTNPQTRWVSKECFKSNSSANSSSIEEKSVSNNQDSNLDSALVLSWHNAFCETHSNKKECKRDGGDAKNRLVLHGLWPQPRNNVYCGVSKEIIKLDKMKRWNALPPLNLKPEVKELMAIYMPGSQSNLQRHEYYKHGTCYSKDPNEYFLDALTLTKKADETIGEYLRANLGKKIKAINVKLVADRLLAKGAKGKVAIKCKRRVLSEVWISLKGKGRDFKKLLKNAKNIRSNCVEAIVDKPGKFRR
jgi:ribonuclease T2